MNHVLNIAVESPASSDGLKHRSSELLFQRMSSVGISNSIMETKG
jgi:hypothetical protein